MGHPRRCRRRPAEPTTCSVDDRKYYSADLQIRSTTTTSTNGHTVGTFTLRICNNGTLPIPVGTQYTVVLSAEKSPNDPGGDKNIAVSSPTSTGATVTPSDPVTLNPDGPVTSRTYTITTTTPIAVGSCTEVTWSIDTVTGIGATKLRMTAKWVVFGGGACSFPANGNEQSVTGLWGKDAT